MIKDVTDPITAPRLRLSMFQFSNINNFSVSLVKDI